MGTPVITGAPAVGSVVFPLFFDFLLLFVSPCVILSLEVFFYGLYL